LLQADVVSAAWALVVSQLAVGILNFSLLLPKLKIRVMTLLSLVFRPLVATGLMVGAVLFAKTLMRSQAAWPEQLGSLLLVVVLGALVYGAALFALWVGAARPEGAESRVHTLLSERFEARTQAANRRD
jgi:hypothetical protein